MISFEWATAITLSISIFIAWIRDFLHENYTSNELKPFRFCQSVRCSRCSSDINTQSLVRLLGCGHQFHETCIVNWDWMWIDHHWCPFCLKPTGYLSGHSFSYKVLKCSLRAAQWFIILMFFGTILKMTLFE